MIAGRVRRVVVAVFIALPLLAGCGAGDDQDGPTMSPATEALSAEERYANRATAICRRERRAIAEQLADFRSEHGDPARSVALAEDALEEVVLPGFRRQYEGLRKLWPPRGEEDFFDLMLSKFSRSLENGEEDLNRLFRVKPSGYSEFGEGTLMTEEVGIEGCGSQGRSPQAVYRGLQNPGA